MQDLPTCSQCGQDEEFLVTETGGYVCICGHRFEMMALDTNNDETQPFTYQEDKHSSGKVPYQHNSSCSLLH